MTTQEPEDSPVYRYVGGPLDGDEWGWTASVIRVTGYPDHEYVRTRPTDTNWRETYDHDWLMHGLSEPPPVPDKVMEWHERGWLSPEVRAIRAVVEEASRG